MPKVREYRIMRGIRGATFFDEGREREARALSRDIYAKIHKLADLVREDDLEAELHLAADTVVDIVEPADA